jgi:hypothetical protein
LSERWPDGVRLTLSTRGSGAVSQV